MGFDPVDHGGHGCVVGVEDRLADVVVAEGEEHRHRLGRRGGDVKAPHRILAEAPAQLDTGGRVRPGHHRQERLVAHLAGQAERCGPGSPTLCRRLAAVEVVAGQGLDVVDAGLRSLQRCHSNGHQHLPASGVHSSFID
jgi:hypothetical protein